MSTCTAIDHSQIHYKKDIIFFVFASNLQDETRMTNSMANGMELFITYRGL